MKTPLFLAFFLISQCLSSQEDDRNIILESKIQEFHFEKAKGSTPIQVKEKYVEIYRCNQYRTDILFSEMYNENEVIENIDIKVNGSKAKWIEPQYDYYSVENIFYSDARVCYFHLPFEKKDSKSEVKLEKTYKDPKYFTTVYFNEPYFVETKTISFVVPRWMKVELKEFNFQGYNIKKSSDYNAKDDEDIIKYTISALPALKSESYAPGSSFIKPHLLVLCKEAITDKGRIPFFSTLDDQYQWYHQLVSREDQNSAIAEKAKELTEHSTGDIEKVKTVFNWVQHNIRYIAFEDGIAGFKPAKAADVMNKRYGDCKGMASLMKSLLKGLGYDARLCWLGTNHIAYDYSTPSMAVDNHMICAWFYQGKKYFLDATETNIGFNEYAERIQNRQVLIENGNNYILDRVPSTKAEQNINTQKINLKFDGATNLAGTVVQSYKGESRSDLLTKIQMTKKDNLQRSLESYLSENNQDYVISNLKTTDLLGADSVLQISYDLHHNKAASAFGNEIYLEIDYSKDLEGFVIDQATRTMDVVLPFKTYTVIEAELQVPQGYKVSQLPSNANWKHPNIDISISYKQQANKIFYRKEVKINDVMLKKKAFDAWDTIMKDLTHQYHEQIVFVKQ